MLNLCISLIIGIDLCLDACWLIINMISIGHILLVTKIDTIAVLQTSFKFIGKFFNCTTCNVLNSIFTTDGKTEGCNLGTILLNGLFSTINAIGGMRTEEVAVLAIGDINSSFTLVDAGVEAVVKVVPLMVTKSPVWLRT